MSTETETEPNYPPQGTIDLLNLYVGKTIIQTDWSWSTENERILNILFEDGSLLQLVYLLPSALTFASGAVQEEDKNAFKIRTLPILKGAAIKLTAEAALLELELEELKLEELDKKFRL